VVGRATEAQPPTALHSTLQVSVVGRHSLLLPPPLLLWCSDPLGVHVPAVAAAVTACGCVLASGTCDSALCLVNVLHIVPPHPPETRGALGFVARQ
jgi:hypothetical protein